ncbi:hypothetical protein DVH24_006198 [Malus domestica]|uniref:Uncharacterized protein n=1 Tax=Malus domestica TaxID=3750 RepID=A0A498KQX3_MALDO|nr:hypothetical protein DVH24_006198 [Malus domestica]
MIICQVAEPQVARLCAEAQECMVMDMGGSIWCPLCLTSVEQEEDKVSFEMCLCGALGVGLEARNQN